MPAERAEHTEVVGQPTPTARHGACQRLAVPGDIELAGDLRSRTAGNEQRAGLHADLFECLASCMPGRCGGRRLLHAATLPGHSDKMSPGCANLF
jgi:hypothetical protein